MTPRPPLPGDAEPGRNPDAYSMGQWRETEALLDFLEAGGSLDDVPIAPVKRQGASA